MARIGSWVRPNHSAPKITHLPAILNPEQDVYDCNGYATNKRWVFGPSTFFKSIMDAMYMSDWQGMYDAFFLMEMDTVPI